jgi:hypothetical protein
MSDKLLAGISLLSVMSLHQINAEAINLLISNLSLIQLIILTVTGSLLVDRVHFDGWKTKLPLYLIKCPIHGYQLTIPSGFDHVLHCPKCIDSTSN